MKGMLAVVPCGKAKVWDKEAGAGPTEGRDAYVGPPFKANREYAERFGERWVILSGKYGFISPEFMIPGPYDVTFKDPSTTPISVAELREQVDAEGLGEYRIVIGLGSKDYQERVAEALRGRGVEVRFPFAGLRMFEQIGAVKRAVERGEPFGK